ncbi:MAG: lactate utilization protein [Oscillospiraceae bacterium]|nr:lactate utilization protein [Oscillospiraceae bacterium]
MDENMKNVILNRINRTAAALKKNNMEFHYAESKVEVLTIVSNLLKTGDVVATGGSVTLEQCGIIDLLRTDKYKFLDRDAIDTDKMEQLFRASFNADTYLCSANAITENGELYNVDGNCNRIAAICYGPKSVIIVAGYNKIVTNLDEAVSRVKNTTAPANAQRLTCPSYCYEKGQCMSLLKDKPGMTDGCDSDYRLCSNYLISAHQREKGRIKVIIVGEKLGY